MWFLEQSQKKKYSNGFQTVFNGFLKDLPLRVHLPPFSQTNFVQFWNLWPIGISVFSVEHVITRLWKMSLKYSVFEPSSFEHVLATLRVRWLCPHVTHYNKTKDMSQERKIWAFQRVQVCLSPMSGCCTATRAKNCLFTISLYGFCNLTDNH